MKSFNTLVFLLLAQFIICVPEEEKLPDGFERAIPPWVDFREKNAHRKYIAELKGVYGGINKLRRGLRKFKRDGLVEINALKSVVMGFRTKLGTNNDKEENIEKITEELEKEESEKLEKIKTLL